jgi:hypothetical protein
VPHRSMPLTPTCTVCADSFTCKVV